METKMKKILSVVLILVLFSLSIYGCSELKMVTYHKNFPLMVQSVSEIPEGFDLLITTGDSKFITYNEGWYKDSAGEHIKAACYYEQVWLENVEDSIWVFREDTSVTLLGDIIRHTQLHRQK